MGGPRERSAGDLGFGLLAVGLVLLYAYLYATTDYVPTDPELWWVATTGVVGTAALLRYASARYRRAEPYVDAAVAAAGFGVALYAVVVGNSTLAGIGGLVGVVLGAGALYEFHQRGALGRTRHLPALAGLLGAAFVAFGVYLRARYPGSGVAAMALTSVVVGVVALAWAVRQVLDR